LIVIFIDIRGISLLFIKQIVHLQLIVKRRQAAPKFCQIEVVTFAVKLQV
jgi:hypothetical protein